MNNTIDINSRNTPTIHQLRRAGWKVRVIHGKYDNNDELFDRYTRIEQQVQKAKILLASPIVVKKINGIVNWVIVSLLAGRLKIILL